MTKDTDFHQRSLLLGAPPKVIWIRRGNCSTRQLAELLIALRDQIERFVVATVETLLVLDWPTATPPAPDLRPHVISVG